jgi:hypothetical protein
MHHRERVSAQRICREDIDLRELKRGHTFGDANYKYTERYITASENQSPATFIFSINKLSKHFASKLFQYTCKPQDELTLHCDNRGKVVRAIGFKNPGTIDNMLGGCRGFRFCPVSDSVGSLSLTGF